MQRSLVFFKDFLVLVIFIAQSVIKLVFYDSSGLSQLGIYLQTSAVY